ncbi:MAG TPA: DUF1080 domain-containing protein [Gemmataceae bacterium]|nr:DUF1080 domain-containing protein [Gemmataceae bacterium]
MSDRLGAILAGVAGLALLAAPARGADNELTPAEKNDGWILLFNGKDLTGWHRTSPGFGTWKVEDGAICLTGRGGGMLYTDERYDNFILKVDFKMSPRCNSGVFVRVGDPKTPVQTGLEVQVLDDQGRKPTRNSCGAIYDLVAPSKAVTRPAGEWNTFVITCNKNLITVELNGEKICAMNVDEWDKPGLRPDGSKHKYQLAIKDFPRKGLIGFQDHGTPVCYKNIKLKPLK